MKIEPRVGDKIQLLDGNTAIVAGPVDESGAFDISDNENGDKWASTCEVVDIISRRGWRPVTAESVPRDVEVLVWLPEHRPGWARGPNGQGCQNYLDYYDGCTEDEAEALIKAHERWGAWWRLPEAPPI